PPLSGSSRRRQGPRAGPDRRHELPCVSRTSAPASGLDRAGPGGPKPIRTGQPHARSGRHARLEGHENASRKGAPGRRRGLNAVNTATASQSNFPHPSHLSPCLVSDVIRSMRCYGVRSMQSLSNCGRIGSAGESRKLFVVRARFLAALGMTALPIILHQAAGLVEKRGFLRGNEAAIYIRNSSLTLKWPKNEANFLISKIVLLALEPRRTVTVLSPAKNQVLRVSGGRSRSACRRWHGDPRVGRGFRPPRS